MASVFVGFWDFSGFVCFFKAYVERGRKKIEVEAGRKQYQHNHYRKDT